jgi:hypothetical protein
MIMNTFVKLYFENNVFIINSELLKFKYIWSSWLTRLLINLKNQIKILFQNVYSD